MPASVYNTPEARIRQAIFKFIQMHMKYHLRTIRQTITNNSGSPSNRYYNINKKGLTQALQSLAELYVDGQDVTIDDVEAAISAYAAEHPKSIKIASKSGYNEVYLTGPWPDTIRMSANGGDSTVIIIVNEYGQQTTINADGTVTTGTDEGSNGSSQGSGSGTNTGNGSETPGTDGGSDSGNGTSGTGTGGGSNPEPSTGGDNTGGNTGGGNTGDGWEEG